MKPQGPQSNKARKSIHGTGIGLRALHYAHVLEHLPEVPWFEVLTDNYLTPGGPCLDYLFNIREHYPMVMHGVGMSLGSTDPLNNDYLKKVKSLAQRLEPAYISDHLCWISVEETYAHELLPLPYTEMTAKHVAQRIQAVQDFLGQRILVENVSSYLAYRESNMTEWEFINCVADQADCYILLDINNIYVSSYNHNFSPEDYLNAINPERVKQFHIAGYQDRGSHLLDTHGACVSNAVWELYKKAVKRFKNVPALLEWDNNIPDFPVLMAEAEKAQAIVDGEKKSDSIESPLTLYQAVQKTEPCSSNLESVLKHATLKKDSVVGQQSDVQDSGLRSFQKKLLHSLVGEDSQRAAVLSNIKHMKPLSNEQRLQIYKNSMHESLLNVVREVYEVCCKLVGKEFFDEMARIYIQQTPSHSPNLDDYGAQFSTFIAHFSPADALPYLSGVAQLEWAWHVACLSQADRQSLEFSDLAKVPLSEQMNIVFTLPSTHTLLQSDYPLLRIWKMNQDGCDSDDVNENIDLNEGGMKLFVWRDSEDMRMDVVSDVEQWNMLNQIANKCTMGEIYEQWDEQGASERMAGVLQQLMSNGWIRGFHTV